MKRMMKTAAWLGLLAGATLSADAAAEMKNVLILNFPYDNYRVSMTARVIDALKQAGFEDRQNIAISMFQSQNIAEGIAKVQELAPDVVIDISVRNRILNDLNGSAVPLIASSDIEPFVDAQGVPKANITGVYSVLQDMVYNSYKFLQKVAPLQPGQQAVFLENTLSNRIPKEAALDALKRLGIPLKAVADASVYEDWQAAILKYNDDPEVGWILMGVWPSIKRDGSVPDMEHETAAWQREHLKKPMVTYWEIAVQWAMLCGFGMDLDDVGRQCGEMAARVLKGEEITTIKAEYPRKTLVVLNRKTADTLGITFSLDVLNLANVIYHDWEGKNVSRKSGLK